jgi:uncharacterized protein YeaO (DUF488 family)
MLKLKRAYEPASQEDGQRFLVERLWPRGVKKTSLHFDAWLQRSGSDRTLPDVVPVRLDKAAETLPISWDHDRTAGAVRHWAQRPSRRGTVTLVYSSHDREHNNAIALRAYLETKLGKKHRATSRKSSA